MMPGRLPKHFYGSSAFFKEFYGISTVLNASQSTQGIFDVRTSIFSVLETLKAISRHFKVFHQILRVPIEIQSSPKSSERLLTISIVDQSSPDHLRAFPAVPPHADQSFSEGIRTFES